jgi:poly(A) polymerase
MGRTTPAPANDVTLDDAPPASSPARGAAADDLGKGHRAEASLEPGRRARKADRTPEPELGADQAGERAARPGGERRARRSRHTEPRESGAEPREPVAATRDEGAIRDGDARRETDAHGAASDDEPRWRESPARPARRSDRPRARGRRDEAQPEAEAPRPARADAVDVGEAGDGRTPQRYPVVFDDSRIDPDVQKVVRRLVRHGHEAYLVGGCVRDLLLDRHPKDFDVATSARPEQVRELFRNSRIIGRRFRLVHVLFQGGKFFEVATFRRSPRDEAEEGHDLLIRNDNVFGDAHEDATRRDFTINALFYDLEAHQVLDWVGGLGDIQRRVVHTIGDPETRFREDPVRILRALKFAGRLDLGITADVYDAVVFCRESLALAARPRLSEEILRLLRGGQARRTIYLAWETGVLDVLLPELAALLYDDGEEDGAGQRVWRLLDWVDRRTAEDGPLDDTVLWTLLLLEPMREACEGVRDRSAAVADFLEPLVERLAISRRYADGMRRIVAVLPKLVSGRAGRFARTEIFAPAVEVATADLTARGEPTDALTRAARGGSGSSARPAAPERRPRRR